MLFQLWLANFITSSPGNKYIRT